MAKLGKITSFKREVSSDFSKTYAHSLFMNGHSRTPGTKVILTPFKEVDGSFRTGLDPEALYIRQITNKEAREAELERVKSLREELEKKSGLITAPPTVLTTTNGTRQYISGLGPRADYYDKIFDAEANTPTRARMVMLAEGDNVYHLDEVQDAITFAWLRVHPAIAPSYDALLEGRVKNAQNVQFYVSDTDELAAKQYNDNLKRNKAIGTLNAMSPLRQKKVAKLLGMPVTQNTKPELIYNMLNDYISQTKNKGGKMYTVNHFNQIAEMPEDNLEVQYLVEQLLTYNIVREKNMRIMDENGAEVASTKQDFINLLSKPTHQEDLIGYQERLNAKQKLEIIDLETN